MSTNWSNTTQLRTVQGVSTSTKATAATDAARTPAGRRITGISRSGSSTRASPRVRAARPTSAPSSSARPALGLSTSR